MLARSRPTARRALVWGLRRPRDEPQLTNVIAAIASSDVRFATEFVIESGILRYDVTEPLPRSLRRK
jgi:hypothetical protein